MATPSTNPGTPDGPVFWIAGQNGQYSNFGNQSFTVAEEAIGIFSWDGSSWSFSVVSIKPAKNASSISDNAIINDCVKELYVVSNIDVNSIICGRLHYGSSHTYGIEFCSTPDYATTVLELRGTTDSNIITDNSGNYAVVDWDKIAEYCGNSHYRSISSISIDSKIKHIEFWPFINSYITLKNADYKPRENSNNIVKSSGVFSAFNDLDLIDTSGTETGKTNMVLNLRKNDGTEEEPDYRVLSELIINPATRQKAGLLTAENAKKLYHFNISDNDTVNACVKELYIPNIDLSNVAKFRLQYGANQWYGVDLFESDYTSVKSCIKQDVDLNKQILTDNQTFWVVLDWSKMQEACGSTGYIDFNIWFINNKKINSLEFNPYIASYIESQRALESDLAPIYNGLKFISSGNIFDGLYGGISKSDYNTKQIKVKGDGNIVFSTDENGKVTATVGSDGVAQGMYFGFSDSVNALKANTKYLVTGLYKNEGFADGRLYGLIQVYSTDGSGRLLQNTIPIINKGNGYLSFEKELFFEHPFIITWLCIYHPNAGIEAEGAKLTYLDTKILDTSSITSEDSLNGPFYQRISDIVSLYIENLENSNYYNHVVDVYPDVNTPCQIANLIRSITDASASNRYKILVHDGEYAETDIITKDYIDIIGEHYEDVVLVHDGSATYNSPSNYSLGNQYSNIPVNEIPWNYKHLIYHMSNSMVKNLTLKTTGGGCKYICHQDSSSAKFTAIFEHCNFVNGSGTAIIGVGANAGQHFRYIDCNFFENQTFDRAARNSFNLHNWTNKNEPCSLRMESCNFTHCGWIDISELGSGQSDYFEFINCSCDVTKYTFIAFGGITYTETQPSYSMILRIVGGNLGGIVPKGSRQNTKLSIQSPYISTVQNTNNIPFGTALDKNGAVVANANNGFVFKLSDINGASIKTVNTFDVGFGLAEAGNYVFGDTVYINNGRFTKTINGDIAGTVKQAITLEEDGHVMIQKA